MRKLTSLFVAATLAVGAANIVHAAADNLTPAPAGVEKGMQHKGARHGGGPHDMFKNLNLTDAQKQQMRDIMKESRKEMKRPSPEERRAVHSIIAADSFDRTKADALATQMSADGKARALNMMVTQNKMYNVLTSEQKKQFNQQFEKRLAEKPQHQDKMLPVEN